MNMNISVKIINMMEKKHMTAFLKIIQYNDYY